jgi:hypothetical protein
MQTSGKTKGELVLETHSRIQGTTVRDISQNGIKIEINSTGQSKGKYESNDISTTSVWMKTDGTSEWESKGIQNTRDGQTLAVWGKGTGKSTGPTTQAWEGELHVMTQSPKLGWMNTAEFWIEGTGDQAKGESHAKMYHRM